MLRAVLAPPLLPRLDKLSLGICCRSDITSRSPTIFTVYNRSFLLRFLSLIPSFLFASLYFTPNSHFASRLFFVSLFSPHHLTSPPTVMRIRKAARVILIGAPGVGKGTQSERLLGRFPQLAHLSSGDLLRHNVKTKTPLGMFCSAFYLVPCNLALTTPNLGLLTFSAPQASRSRAPLRPEASSPTTSSCVLFATN